MTDFTPHPLARLHPGDIIWTWCSRSMDREDNIYEPDKTPPLRCLCPMCKPNTQQGAQWMTTSEPSHTELICRMLSVMPARYIAKLANRLAMIYGDTGHGEIVITVYRGKVVQVDTVIKDR